MKQNYPAYPTGFIRAYAECALWSSCDDNDTPLDKGRDTSDISRELWAAMRADCARFLFQARRILRGLPDFDMAQAGNDLWLTRNGHGAGFWDRGLGDPGDALSAIAEKMRGVDLYVDDNGKVRS